MDDSRGPARRAGRHSIVALHGAPLSHLHSSWRVLPFACPCSIASLFARTRPSTATGRSTAGTSIRSFSPSGPTSRRSFSGCCPPPSTLFGESAAAARFVNIAASTLTIPVAAALARHWWGASVPAWSPRCCWRSTPLPSALRPPPSPIRCCVLCGLLGVDRRGARPALLGGRVARRGDHDQAAGGALRAAGAGRAAMAGDGGEAHAGARAAALSAAGCC